MEWWRPLTSLLFSSSAEQLLSNVINILGWIVFMEIFMKSLRCTFIFFLSGITGSLLAIAMDKGNTLFLGASCGLFGLYGSLLSFLLFNWKKMDHEQNPR
jgi:membrane associated rhomboid family serine protease